MEYDLKVRSFRLVRVRTNDLSTRLLRNHGFVQIRIRIIVVREKLDFEKWMKQGILSQIVLEYNIAKGVLSMVMGVGREVYPISEECIGIE